MTRLIKRYAFWGTIGLLTFLSPKVSVAETLGGVASGSTLQIGNIALSPTINVGYNNLLDGYDGYTNLGNGGFDIYLKVETDDLIKSWQDNFLFRVSFDYFPLEVPDGNFGLEEEMFAFTGSIIYQFYSGGKEMNQSLIPFFGIGAGSYLDRVTLDTPATGKVSGTTTHFGYNASVGLMIPEFKFLFPIRMIPEVRYHSVNVPEGTATNMTYQVAFQFWPFQ